MTTTELSAASLKVRAGSTTILDGLSFSLRPGELVALIGPSGAGKSTLIKVLLGLRAPSAGEVRLGGKAPGDAGVPIGYVPQHDALHTTLSVRAALDFAAQLRLPGLSAEERATRIGAVCQQVGLDERMDLKIGRLSGGQKKRVSVAMELLTEPAVLILDEPTSGLDPGLEARMMALFQALARRGRIVMVATHAMESLERCDAVMVLMKGQQAFLGDPAGALSFFRVERFAALFDQLPKQTPAAWARAWARSDERRRFEGRPGVGVGPDTREGAPNRPHPASRSCAATLPRKQGRVVWSSHQPPLLAGEVATPIPGGAGGGDLSPPIPGGAGGGDLSPPIPGGAGGGDDNHPPAAPRPPTAAERLAALKAARRSEEGP